MTEFLGIDHLGVAVRNLEAATRVYGDILGFVVTGGETLTERGIEVRFVETGDSGAGHPRIELLGSLREDSEISGFLAKRGEGVHHICVRVRDIDAALADMRERGAKIIGDGVQAGAHDTRVAFLHPKSTHGVLIELVESKE